MSKLLKFNTIIYDSKKLTEEVEQTFSFFSLNNSYSNYVNETRQDEAVIVNWFIYQPSFRKILLNELKLPFYSVIRPNIKEPIIKSPYNNPGDIDILIFDKDQPNRAVAIECKMVNVEKQPGKDKPNKINKIKKAVKQTKGLLDMGFHKVYLAIIIATYGVNSLNTNFLSRGMDVETFQKVYNFQHRENLDDRVGVIFIEIVQPSNNSINLSGVIGVCLEKPAGEQEQSLSITQGVSYIFA